MLHLATDRLFLHCVDVWPNLGQLKQYGIVIIVEVNVQPVKHIAQQSLKTEKWSLWDILFFP